MNRPGRAARARRGLARAAVAVLALYGLAALTIAWVGLNDRTGTADIIVVPGNTVQADGTPSARLKARLDAAVVLFKDSRAPLVFVSGGTGREGHDEARVMAAYLISQGIPESAVVLDSQGHDTAATAAHAAVYLRQHQRSSALVATQYFHVARTTLALQRQGVDVAGFRHARHIEWRDAYSLAREVIGYAAYRWGPRSESPEPAARP